MVSVKEHTIPRQTWHLSNHMQEPHKRYSLKELRIPNQYDINTAIKQGLKPYKLKIFKQQLKQHEMSLTYHEPRRKANFKGRDNEKEGS